MVTLSIVQQVLAYPQLKKGAEPYRSGYFRRHARTCTSLLILPLTLLFIGVQGCGDYQKVLKSTDPEFKWEKAQEYFADDRCLQSLPLLQELIGLFRGTERMEDVYFMYAEAHLCAQDWFMGRYSMRNFAKTFPNSDRSEEAEFRAALCSYRLSPGPELDQSETQVAMDELQLFSGPLSQYNTQRQLQQHDLPSCVASWKPKPGKAQSSISRPANTKAHPKRCSNS